MMRVLFVSHTATVSGAELILADAVLPWRGATAFLFEGGDLSRLLSERGLIVREARNGAGRAGFRRDSSPMAALPMVKRLAGLTAELANAARSHDVVYANSQKAFVLAAAATALVRRPLVWHLHDIIDPVHFGGAQRRLQVWLANRRASLVIVPSRAAAEAFVAQGGRRDLVEVVPNGLAVESDGRDRGAVRRALGLPDVPLVGVVSRLAAWKGQDVVLRALSDLPGVHAVIAGDPLFGEQRYAQGLERLAAELGLADRVHFLGQRSDVPCLMRAMDAVIHPSVHPEPFGRTLVEAMLVGVPVIATDTGASSEILEDGRAGTLVPAGDPSALAAAIAQVLTRPAGLDAQLAHATARARTHYGLDRMRGLLTRHIHRVGRGTA